MVAPANNKPFLFNYERRLFVKRYLEPLFGIMICLGVLVQLANFALSTLTHQSLFSYKLELLLTIVIIVICSTRNVLYWKDIDEYEMDNEPAVYRLGLIYSILGACVVSLTASRGISAVLVDLPNILHFILLIVLSSIITLVFIFIQNLPAYLRRIYLRSVDQINGTIKGYEGIRQAVLASLNIRGGFELLPLQSLDIQAVQNRIAEADQVFRIHGSLRNNESSHTLLGNFSKKAIIVGSILALVGQFAEIILLLAQLK